MLDFTSINWWLVGAAGAMLAGWLVLKFWPAISGWFQRAPSPTPAKSGLADYVAARETLRAIVPAEIDAAIWTAIGKVPAAGKDGAS